jgi:hypothetical protein
MSFPSPTTQRIGVPTQMSPQELEAMDVSRDCVSCHEMLRVAELTFNLFFSTFLDFS